MKNPRPNEFIGDRVRQLRESRNLSQMHLCRLAGISPTTLYRIEVGGMLTARAEAKLSTVLGPLKASGNRERSAADVAEVEVDDLLSRRGMP